MHLKKGEFVPYLQPKIDCQYWHGCRGGGLGKMDQADGEVIFPDLFIPYFEKAALFTKIDMYMFGEACRILRKWMDEGKEVFPISCNFSYLDIMGSNFINI